MIYADSSGNNLANGGMIGHQPLIGIPLLRLTGARHGRTSHDVVCAVTRAAFESLPLVLVFAVPNDILAVTVRTGWFCNQRSGASRQRDVRHLSRHGQTDDFIDHEQLRRRQPGGYICFEAFELRDLHGSRSGR